MVNTGPRREWCVIGANVRGASHVRAGLPGQDAIAWLPESGRGLPVVVAVSDGHGSAKCFRSDEGARLAVETATQKLQEFQKVQPDSTSLTASKRMAEERLPQELEREWKKTVENMLEIIPFSSEELATVEEIGGVSARQAVETNPLVAYGATILSVLVTESFILYLQLGDGDILTVEAGGEVARPMPADARLFANETTSLCSPNAWHDVQIRFQALAGPPPALILISTDGYSNSFRDDEGFLKVGADFLEIIRSDGLDIVNENLETWLTEASQAGSGDDITLGILCRMDAFNSVAASELSE